MTGLGDWVDELGGMAQKQQLVRRGATDKDLTYAYKAGHVIRARNGWYSTMPEWSYPLRAVRVGGRLTGISAIKERGGWVEKDHPLHVSVKKNAARLRTQRNRWVRFNPDEPAGVILHWDDSEVTEKGTAVSVGLSDALYRVIVDEELEVAVACLDWALHTGELDEIDFHRLILRLPKKYRYIADWVDAACESLPESLARTRLRLRGHTLTSQIQLESRERMDLAADGVAGIEIDGEQFHFGSFEKDYDKRIQMTIEGYHAISTTARMIFNSFDRFYLAVVTALVSRSSPPIFDRGHIDAIARAGNAKAAKFRRPRTREERRARASPRSMKRLGNSSA